MNMVIRLGVALHVYNNFPIRISLQQRPANHYETMNLPYHYA